MSTHNQPIATTGSAPHQREEVLRYWLALVHISGIGPASFHRLLNKFHEPEILFSLPARELQQAGLSQVISEQFQQPDWTAVENDLKWLALPDNHVITCHDPQYPQLLTEISQPPPVLFVHGQLSALKQLQLAIIGSCIQTDGFDSLQQRDLLL